MKKSRYRIRRRVPLSGAVLSPSPDENLAKSIAKAQGHLSLVGFEIDWASRSWSLDPIIFQEIGKGNRSVTLSFNLPPLYESKPLTGDWGEAARMMFVTREVERHKSITSHRTFISVVGFVCAAAQGKPLKCLTREILDAACTAIENSTSSEGEAYKKCSVVHEFVRRCVESGLCYANLGDYLYANLRRPDSHGGRACMRLDDPGMEALASDRVLGLNAYAVLGELFRNVPTDHKYRVFLLIITLLLCTGRRLSEIATLPRQKLIVTQQGVFFVYLKLKGARGSQRRTLHRVPLLTLVVPLVEQVLVEIEVRSGEFYSVADEMCRTLGPDLRFLDGVADDEPLGYERLRQMGMPESMFSSGGCFDAVNRYRQDLASGFGASGGMERNGYVYKVDVEKYCRSHFDPRMTDPLYEADGKSYFLKDMLLLNYVGTSSGHYSRWVVTIIKGISFRNFLKQLGQLVDKYASQKLTQRFTSHDFRHTVNDALDKGHLPDLMQTEFFGRSHVQDTKSYQHTTPEQRALKIREMIKLGQVGGKVAEMAMRAPVERRDAFLMSAVKAAHHVGPGLCFHAWQHGPCVKHLECDTGCDQFAYVERCEGGEEEKRLKRVIEEVKLQLAHNFLTLEVAVSEGVAERAGQWEAHTIRKIHALFDQLHAMGIEYHWSDVDDFINGGGLDGVALSEIATTISDGYSRYVKIRKTYHESVCDTYAKYPEVYGRDSKAIEFIPVKAVGDDLPKDE